MRPRLPAPFTCDLERSLQEGYILAGDFDLSNSQRDGRLPNYTSDSLKARPKESISGLRRYSKKVRSPVEM
jgi:hypothetical protein